MDYSKEIEEIDVPPNDSFEEALRKRRDDIYELGLELEKHLSPSHFIDDHGPPDKSIDDQIRKHQELMIFKLTPRLDFFTQKARLKDILSKLSDENLIKDSGSGKLYTGRLFRGGKLMDIVAWRLDSEYGQGYIQFKKEISMLSSLQHKNIGSILEYYDQDKEKIIIYKGGFHGILDQHLCDPTLLWPRRLQICLGIARALNYIHNDVIHCDINTSKIFLDEDWEPKIFGFELSTKYPQSWKHRLQFSCYFDSTSIITPKYDVYSYGVLLFEVLYWKKPMIEDNGVKEELDEIIDPNLKKQMDTQSLTLFKKIAYNCLNQQLVERPTMDQIVKELEEALELQWKHENLEHLADAEEGISSNRLKMDFLKIPLSEIRLATNNFDEEKVVGSGGYGIVYRAKLDILDIESLSSVEGKCKDELPKKSKTVAIKRIFSRPDDQGKEGFLREIELLTSCKHSNIVSLLGFSREDREMILVYEYASKGSLSEYLGSTCKKINLTWRQRIQICLDIANGINYLHSNMEGKRRIIHRDIKSENILLDENLKAKVADFGLSKFHPTNQQGSTIYTKNIAGTEVYMDPEYLTSFKYKKESDVYSFGVVLFEMLSGRLAYDPMYMMENDKGLAPIVRRRFNEGTLKDLIDPYIREEDHEQIFTLNRGPNQESFDSFSKIAYQCLAETQAKRPTIEAVIKELQYALKLQGEAMVLSRFRLSDIAFPTENFSKTYCCGLDSNGVVYKAILYHFDNKSLLETEGKNRGAKRCIGVAIKCISSRDDRHKFIEEIEMHTSYKHPNIVPLLGFCDEGNDMILVYEHASNGSLDDYLRGTDNIGKYTWTRRLNLCLEIACGLDHLHVMMNRNQGMIHVDLRSANILLGKTSEAKIAYFGISKLLTANQEEGTHISANSTKVYRDPEYEKTGELNKESDIYSYGVVLFEILCGRLAYDEAYIVGNDNGLAPVARRCFNDGTIKQIIDPALKEVIDGEIPPTQGSLDSFLRIAYQCLAETGAERPTLKMVIIQLETALNLHEWVEHEESGVYITVASLPGGAKDLKKVRFSRKRFSEKQAEQWWEENRTRVYEKYNIRNSQTLVEALKDKQVKTMQPYEELDTIGSNRRKDSESQGADDEWVKQYEPGVYITFTSLGGAKNFKQVRFSPKRFSEKQAEQWWEENWTRVYEQYNVGNSPEALQDRQVKSMQPYEELDTNVSNRRKDSESLGADDEWVKQDEHGVYITLTSLPGGTKDLKRVSFRFHTIAEISDISNLKIQIKIRTQFLAVGVNYGVHLIFRFSGAKKSLAKQMYVNLAYKMKKKTLNSYFATWREDEWMTIELYRFLNDKKNTDVEFLLESFLPCYYRGIYVEGLEFQAIDNEQHAFCDSSNKTTEVQLACYDVGSSFTQTLLKSFRRSNKEKYFMVSAMEAICDSSNKEIFISKPSTESRFRKVIELLSTQEFHIKSKIKSKRLLPNTEYTCYLVFKLSEKCSGLQCPVIVGDYNGPEIKEGLIVYFRTPHSWNLPGDDSQVPKERGDGWMEVNLWKFKSKLNNDCISINMKLITYEGTMSGLVVCGLEFRPM